MSCLFNKISFILISYLVFFTTGIFAQVIVERNVIGNTGFSYSGNGLEIDATVGELVVSTDENGPAGILFTQGFHQPSTLLNELLMQLSFGSSLVSKSSCPQAADASAKVFPLTGTPPFTYQWSPNVGNSDSALALVAGNYVVFVTDAIGRTGTVSFTVEPENTECEFLFYSGITPNGDFKNDQWNIVGIENFPQNTVRIFNRWGSLIYAANGYDNLNKVFKGKGINSADLPDGTYFYVVEVNNKKFKGWLELTR
jgi:gliding motility-associated-like protein